ncbi:MAG: Stp1/IreP family PP2C-type Ser/Thr phosphatase [Desulfobacteraceae bacterium]|jgi:protein phosphatase
MRIGADLQVETSGISDVGLQREGNEDSFSVEDALGLYIVADGMGGHLAGEVASQVAVEMINKSYRKWSASDTPEDELFGYPDESLSIQGNYILSSIRLANRVIYEMAVEYDQYHGMGTTVSIVLVTPTLIVAANVGDSRIYMVRDGRIERLSKDHTIVSEQVEMGVMTEEEAATSPLKHILTRNLGSSESVEADVFEIEPSNNDRIILCSDGLTDLVRDEEILEMTQKEDDPGALCRKFIDKSLSRGAHDNATVVTVFLNDMGRRRKGRTKKVGKFFRIL